MAPALTEPLSPNEKLSNSTATATPSTRASSRKVETATTTSLDFSTANATTNNNASTNINNIVNNINNSSNSSNTTGTSIASKRNRNSLHPTTSTRITRSKDKDKDAGQRAERAAVAPSTTLLTENTSSVANQKNNNNKSININNNNNNNNNEQMGLSATALNNNNNNNTTNKSNIETTTELLASVRDTSTEQLLADLTDNFEEAITAEICLRKKLLDVDLNKAAEESGNNNIPTVAAEAEVDILANDDSKDFLQVEAETGGTSKAKLGTLHMEEATVESKPSNLVKDIDDANNAKTKGTTPDDATSSQLQQLQSDLQMEMDEPMCDTTSTKVATEKLLLQRTCALAELPPINTDSTMTASEIEDNLEERLSQLDGTAIASCTQDVQDTTASMCNMVPATPPRTPTQQLQHQQQQQTHQQQLQQLQAQLQQTPPLPISQQQSALTPQSTTSSTYMKDTAASSGTGGGGSGGGDLDQDIEEVLKVLKGFDGSSGTDGLCDLNVFFNEVYTTLNYEEINNSQTATTATTKPSPIKDLHAEIEKKQLSMQRKIDFMVRRLRKLQARYMCKHASEEISGLFELSARLAINKSGSSGVTDTPTASYNEDEFTKAPPIISGRPPAITWQELRKTPVPSAQVCSMLRRLESAANTQQLHTGPPHTHGSSVGSNSHLHFKKTKKAAAQEALAAAAAAAAAAATKDTATIVVPHFDGNVAEELTYVAGLMQTEMREVQTAIDSDATESSSGGESADEMVTYNNPIQQSLSIAKRAAWLYSRDRAAIASRWSWLLSQIADLEIKIRQHSELLQEIMRTKGTVMCGTDLGSALKFASATTSTDTLELVPSSINGYMCIGSGNTTVAGEEVNDTEANAGCCRTRGYVAAQFRKRKLLQTTNIHTISKKAARPSTIKCGCQWPLHPCALCTGRVDPTAPRDLPDTMMMPDRIALLDPGFHPVLSFPEDVSNAIHFEAIARLPDWQQRVMRCQVKSIAKGVWKAEREAAAAAGHAATTKRKYIKKKDRLADDKGVTTTTTAAAASGTTTAASTSTAAALAAAVSASAATTTNSGLSSSGTPTAAGSHNSIIGNVGGVAGIGSASGGAGGGSVSGVLGSGAGGGCGGNGIGTLSTSATPLVANKMTKNAKKSLHCQLAGDAMLEPQSPLSDMHYNNNISSSSHNYVHQTGDYPPPPPAPQNYDLYNPSQVHSSLISNSNSKNSKHRKYATNAYYNNHHHHQQQQQQHQYNNNNNNLHHHYNNHNYNNNSSYYHNNSNGGSGDMSFLCTSDIWDSSTRSRTSSPTHMMGSNSNYHKYERSLDRKNRSSYDIDNIVIPYSVAAATRVEILPYKEIPTPKWRVIAEEAAAAVLAKAAKLKLEADTETVMNDSSDKLLTLTNGVKEADDECAVDELKKIIKKTELTATEEKTALLEQIKEEKNDVATMPEIVKPLKMNNQIANAQALIDEKPQGKLIATTDNNEDCKEIKADNENIVEEPASKKLKTECSPKFVAKAETDAKVEAVKMEIFSDVQLYNDDIDVAEGEETGVEDITDEAMMLRHERALTEERRKFQTYLKFPWSTRSRANRRIDSRAESSGANTPDPTSPAPQTPSVGGGDQESIPSPLAPSTPLNPLDSISETGELTTAAGTSTVNTNAAKLNNLHSSSSSSKRYERRRTTSAKKERDMERRSSTPDPREFIAPYEPLEFPLSDELFESLLRSMPTEFQEFSKNEDSLSTTSTRTTRIRNNVRAGDYAYTRRTSKSALTPVANNARKTQNRTNGKGVVRLKSGNPAAGVHTYENGKINSLDDVDEVALITGDDDDDDDDDANAPEFIAEDDDDDDYPKHHLAPNDDVEDEVLRGPNASSSNIHGTFEAQLDDYEAYVGGSRSMLGDSDGESSGTEPFQDDDPNDPEWKGESEDRSDRLRKKL